MKIGILMCGHAPAEVKEHFGDYDQMFASLLAGYDLTFQAWDVEAMDFPQSVDEADGWLLTGARHGVYEGLPFMAPLEDFVRAAHEQKAPMVGICFGHQLIARALGGRVEKFDGGWAVGRYEYDFDAFGHLHLNAWHQDQVLEPPAGARTIAQAPNCAHAALVYGDHIFTVQPHPEMTNPILSEYVKLRRGTADYPDDMMARALVKAEKPNDEPVIAGEIARFLRAAHAARAGAAHV